MWILLPILLSVALGAQVPPEDGTVRPDQVVFDSILLPRDTVDTGTVFACWARLKNYSDFYVGGWAYLRIVDSAQNRTYYAESSRFNVPPYGYDTAGFRSVQFRVLGAFTALLWLPGGDTVTQRFWVEPDAGVDESPRPQAPSYKMEPTVICRLPSGVAVFDAMGRRVRQPRPGICFIREGRGVGDVGRGHMRRVIITK
jgi:hypothetical protein